MEAKKTLINQTTDASEDEDGEQMAPAVDVCVLCEPTTFYIITIVYMTMITLVSLQFDDITLMLGLLSSFAVGILNFIVPGFLVLASAWKELSCTMRVVIISFVLFGVTQCTITNYFNVVKAQRQLA